MSSKVLIIHAGFHKSGTTALQESFDTERKTLQKLGILYPHIGRKAHHRIAWALTQKPWGWKDRGGERTSIKHWDRIARKINKSSSPIVLLSSEFFSELNEEKIKKIQKDIKREVKVLFTVRPIVKLLASSYQQYLKYGTEADYETWLHSVLDQPGKSKINPTFWKRHFHGEVVNRWVSVLGASQVSVIIVDEQKPEFLFDSVNSYLGLESGVLQAQAKGSNRSLTMEEISLLLQINRSFPKDRDWNEYATFIRDGYIRHLTDHIPAKAGKDRLLTPEWAVAKGNEIGSKNKRELLGTGIEIFGDIDSLDNAIVPMGQPNYAELIDIDTVAAAMLVFDRNTVQRFPVQWLQNILVKRYRKKVRYEIKKRLKR
jgi:hypothetical protein